jgi:hypothetical protein
VARPRWHLTAALPLAWLAARKLGRAAAYGVVGAGVLVDGDHLLDFGWTYATRRRSHFFAPLHAWELVAVLAVVAALRRRRERRRLAVPDRLIAAPGVRLPRAETWPTGLAAGLAAGLLLHLVQDLLTNRPAGPVVYSLTYRVAHGFRRDVTGWSEKTDFHGWSGRPWYTWF